MGHFVDHCGLLIFILCRETMVFNLTISPKNKGDKICVRFVEVFLYL